MHAVWEQQGARLILRAPANVREWGALCAALAWCSAPVRGEDLVRVAQALAPLVAESSGLVDEDDAPLDLAALHPYTRGEVLLELLHGADLMALAEHLIELPTLPQAQLDTLHAWVLAQTCGWHAPQVERRLLSLYYYATLAPPSWDAPVWAAQIAKMDQAAQAEGLLHLREHGSSSGQWRGDAPEWKTREHDEYNARLGALLRGDA